MLSRPLPIPQTWECLWLWRQNKLCIVRRHCYILLAWQANEICSSVLTHMTWNCCRASQCQSLSKMQLQWNVEAVTGWILNLVLLVNWWIHEKSRWAFNVPSSLFLCWVVWTLDGFIAFVLDGFYCMKHLMDSHCYILSKACSQVNGTQVRFHVWLGSKDQSA